MKTVIAASGQTVTDLALEHYGAPDAVWLLADDNSPAIYNIAQVFHGGEELNVRELSELPETINAGGNAVREYVRTQHTPSSGVTSAQQRAYVTSGELGRLRGIGYWVITRDFRVS